MCASLHNDKRNVAHAHNHCQAALALFVLSRAHLSNEVWWSHIWNTMYHTDYHLIDYSTFITAGSCINNQIEGRPSVVYLGFDNKDGVLLLVSSAFENLG